MIVVKVVIEEHLDLGGPMGGSDTPIVHTKVCADDAAALRYAKNWLKTQCGPSHVTPEVLKMGLSAFRKWAADMGPYGVTFVKEKVTQ